MRHSVEVIDPGPLATVQDLGRPGLAAVGVGRSGAADRSSLRLANRLVGNRQDAAAIEVTFGGLALTARGGMYAALTGAPCPMSIHAGDSRRREVAAYSTFWVPDAATLRLGAPSSGLRSCLALRGGVAVAPVLGSRATDTLAGLGPAPLVVGDCLPVADPSGAVPSVEVAPVSAPPSGDVALRVVAGPRDDWFHPEALRRLVEDSFEITSDSDRVGMRLTGPILERAVTQELPSEGMATGSLQVPPSGQPTLLLADHPVTGGYPVIAVVVAGDLDAAAQLRPGQRVRFDRVGER